MTDYALQNTIEVLTDDVHRVRRAVEFANLTTEFSKSNPPATLWQGLGHICLGALAVGNLVVSGAVLVHDIDLVSDGKPLRKQIARTPTQGRLRYQRLNRLAGRKRPAGRIVRQGRPQLGA